MNNLFNKILKIYKRLDSFKKVEFTLAIIFLILMLILFTTAIGWKTVFTSVAINVVYEDMKNLYKELKNKEIPEDGK